MAEGSSFITRLIPPLARFRLNTSQLLIAGVILLHLAITLPLAWLLNIGHDEAYSLETAAHGPGIALTRALHFELQPPFYFALLSIWRMADVNSVFLGRSLSVLCSALMLLVTPQISRHCFRDLSPAWLTSLVALNPFVIWAAIEMRLYALVLLLASLLLWLFLVGFWQAASTWQRHARWLYAITALAGLYTHYYLGFLLFALAVALLTGRKWKSLLVYVSAMVAVGVAFLPMLLIVRWQMTEHTRTVTHAASAIETLRLFSWRMQEYMLPTEWSGAIWPGKLTLLLLLLTSLLVLWFRKAAALVPINLLWWTTTAVILLFFYGALQLTGIELLERNHFVTLFWPLLLSVATLLYATGRRRVLMAWLLISLFFYLTSLVAVYRPLAKSGDWRRVAILLEHEAKPQETIAVFKAAGARSVKLYYSGHSPLVQLPRETSMEKYRPEDYGFRDAQEVAAVLTGLENDAGRFWLVSNPDRECFALGVNLNCGLLEDFVTGRYDVLQDRMFYGSRVRLLQRKTR